MTTPAWSAPVNGAPGNLNATDSASQLNQLLGAHAIQQLGVGNAIATPTSGQQDYFVHYGNLGTTDFAQAFTMSGSTIGRVTVPIQVFGNGADLLFSLCPDSSGVPNTASPICQVKIPAAVLTELSASNGLENSTSTLASPNFNTQFSTNYAPTVNWISPAATVNGSPSYFAVTTSGNYTILAGGRDQITNASVAVVYSVQYTGGGTVAGPVPQPSLPQATQSAMLTATSDTVVFIGGFTSGTTVVANVWSASWNPNTGVIGAWSAQTALPQATQNGAAVSSGEHIYVVGGQTGTTAATTITNVWMNTAQNSQLGSWIAQPPLPLAVNTMFAGVVGNWLVVAGGSNTSGNPVTNCYYAPIGSDGSLGAWRTGPSMPQAANTLVPQWCTGVTTSSLIADSGTTTGGGAATYIQVLSVGPTGVAPSWNAFTAWSDGQRASSAFTDGTGNWYVMGYNINNTAQQNFFQPVALASVPLYATGLTNGSPYWVVIQELQSGSASDYMGIGVTPSAYSTDAKTSARHQNSWSSYFAGWSVPMTVYDATPSYPPLHTVEDLVTGTQSAVYERWSTLLYTAQSTLLGAVEVTMQPNNTLNSNPTFTSGVSPWTATNGTITRSSAQTHGGFAFSGLLTPTGGFTQAYATSEEFPVTQTNYGSAEWVLATGWFYTPTTWSNFALAINWFDQGGNFISNSAAFATLTGATWTQISLWAQPPATAAKANLAPTMNGTPGSSNTLFMSNVQLLIAPECVPALASIAEVNYAAGTSWPPIGVTQLN